MHPDVYKTCKIHITLIAFFLTIFTNQLKAEGSIDLNRLEGTRYYRLYLEWYPSSPMQVTALDGVPSSNKIYAYVVNGEHLLLASSNLNPNGDASFPGSGSIRYTKPDGTTIVTLTGTGANNSVGCIFNRAQEKQGPNGLLSGGSGYTPFDITADQTGIWTVEFISQSPTHTNGTGGGPVRTTANWPANQRRSIAAWDVSVTNASVTSLILGRVYARWLPFNPGGITFSGSPVTSTYELYVRTRDGILYKWKQTDYAGYGHSIFSNNSGILDLGMNRLFQSLKFQPAPAPADKRLYSPEYNDIDEFYANKMFFNPPNAALPATAKLGSITNHWLNPIYSSTPPTFFFTPATPAPVNPMAGKFTTYYTTVQQANIIIDCNGDGIYGNANDRRIDFYTKAADDTVVVWNGLDGAGVALPKGCYLAQLQLQNGEVHFPMLDIENNFGGIKLERLNGPGTLPDSTIYWNDLPLNDNTETPAGSYLKQSPPGGISSNVNSHRWANAAVLGYTQTHSTSYGDARFMDTWSYATTTATSVIQTVCSVLPIAITHTSASYSDEAITVIWETANDNETTLHAVERSNNGTDFNAVATLAGKKSSTGKLQYAFADKSFTDGSVYYRIRITGGDNKISYSKTIKVQSEKIKKDNISIYPNPVKNSGILEINAGKKTEAIINIINTNGSKIITKKIILKQGYNLYPLNEAINLPAGVYIITVTGLADKVLRKTLIKL